MYEKKTVTVIGGANMDINGFSAEPLNMGDSNPGRIEYCPGGVGRNIAENLHRLGVKTRFIGVIGNDPGGEFIKKSSAEIGLDISHSFFPINRERATSVYLALSDSDGSLKLALADMEIMEQMTTETLESKTGIISQSEILVLDANLPEKILDYLTEHYGGIDRNEITDRNGRNPIIFFDAVSERKAPKAASRLSSFHTLKLGRMEASVLSGIDLTGEVSSLLNEKLKQAAGWFIGKGLGRVFITLGKDGVYYADTKKSFYTPVQYVKPVNTSGGGDAFMAGIIYGTLEGWDEETIVRFSLAMAKITVQCRFAVDPRMNLELVRGNMVH